MALVSRARGTFYGQRTGGAPHRRAVFIGFGPLAGGAAGARERSLKSSHFVAPLFEYRLFLPPDTGAGRTGNRPDYRGTAPQFAVRVLVARLDIPAGRG